MPDRQADDEEPPARPLADSAITDVFAARRAGAEASTAPPVGYDRSGSPEPALERGEGRLSTEELAELGLPVRVRQASLAPQLRDSRPAQVPPPAPPVEPDGASPEEARSTMSALQRGWQLGRAEAGGWPAATDAEPDDAAGPADDEPPPATAGTDEHTAD